MFELDLDEDNNDTPSKSLLWTGWTSWTIEERFWLQNPVKEPGKAPLVHMVRGKHKIVEYKTTEIGTANTFSLAS